VDEETTDTFMDEMVVAGNTAELLEELGAPLEVELGTFEQEKTLIDAVVKEQKVAPLKTWHSSGCIWVPYGLW
jgi:transcriptional regulator